MFEFYRGGTCPLLPPPMLYYVMMSSFTTHVCHHTQDGESALMWAALCDHTAVVQELVKSGATLDIQDKVCC